MLDKVALAATFIPNKLRCRPLEALTLLWETQMQWIDEKHQNRLRDSRWYWNWFQI